MSITNFQTDFPPYILVVLVVNHIPKAASTYLHLWKNKDNNNSVAVNMRNIRKEHCISPAKFNHDVLLLEREGIVHVRYSHKNKDIMHIEMIDPIED